MRFAVKFTFGARLLPWKGLLATLLAGTVGLSAGRAQQVSYRPAPHGPGGAHGYPSLSPLSPPCLPGIPGMPAAPGTQVPPLIMPPADTTTPPSTTPPASPPSTATPPTFPSAETFGAEGMAPPPLGTELAAAVGGGTVALGSSNTTYIDSAIPRTQLRIRFDTMWDNNRPDRGEFFYPKCGCFKVAGVDPSAEGPPLEETEIDSTQELHTYLEYAVSDRFSVFTEIPIRWINPEINDNTSGLGDINAGFKYALFAEPCQVTTFQLRVYAPSGDGFKGLGTEHWSIEPAILYYRRLSERLTFEAELRDWISIGGSDFAGNVLRYGVGLGYTAVDTCNFHITPMVELVGWTFLDGKESSPDIGIQDATGDTIVNAKAGVRFGLGNRREPGLMNQSDFAISYGRALTGEVLYKDVLRLELRVRY